MTQQEELAERVWRDLDDRFGDDLRAVVRYRNLEYAAEMRPDVPEDYEDVPDAAIVDDTIVDQLRARDTETMVQAGDLDAIVKVFDDAWFLAWPDGLPAKSGFIVSLARSGGGARDLEAAIDRLEAFDEDLAD
ncbi:MAG: hypothetical protein ABEI98_07780 [Halorhabdus sp.]